MFMTSENLCRVWIDRELAELAHLEKNGRMKDSTKVNIFSRLEEITRIDTLLNEGRIDDAILYINTYC